MTGGETVVCATIADAGLAGVVDVLADVSGLDVDRAPTVTDVYAALAEDEVACLVTEPDADASDPWTLLRSIRAAYPAVDVVAVVDASTTVEAALAAGATDVVTAAELRRDAGGDLLRARVRNVAGGPGGTGRAGLLDALFERVPLHLYVKDGEGRHLRVSEGYVSDTRRLLGRRDHEILGIEHASDSVDDDRAVIAEGRPVLDKTEHVDGLDQDLFSATHLRELYPEEAGHSEGFNTWVLTSKVPWYGPGGEVVGLIGVTRDVSDREEYRRQLEAQNERLEAFASIVSHDLRNPLNVAQGNLELAREADDGDEYVERVGEAHDRMSALIEDLLSLARQGQVVDEVEPVDLGAVSHEAWASIASADATLSTSGGTVAADRGRLQELLENLFRNGVEHAGSEVAVTVGPLDEGFFVADDGPGIPPADRESVFEHGYTTSDDGTGFGLAIVRSIAEAHGWTVDVTESAAGGARFEFRE